MATIFTIGGAIMAMTKAPVTPDLVDDTGAYIFRKSFTTKSGKKIVSKNGKPADSHLKCNFP
ncbi:hypothetical protein AN159_05525 [Neisseria meningitidis]|nr:hypothetical protein AN159_05525 [Neisseria meningitidis]